MQQRLWQYPVHHLGGFGTGWWWFGPGAWAFWFGSSPNHIQGAFLSAAGRVQQRSPRWPLVSGAGVWFGTYGTGGFLTLFLISFFPVVGQHGHGLGDTGVPELQDVLRSLGASQTGHPQKAPARSMPYFFRFAEVAITLAFVGSVISETRGVQPGYG